MEKEEVLKQEKEIETNQDDDKEIEEELEYSFEVGV